MNFEKKHKFDLKIRLKEDNKKLNKKGKVKGIYIEKKAEGLFQTHKAMYYDLQDELMIKLPENMINGEIKFKNQMPNKEIIISEIFKFDTIEELQKISRSYLTKIKKQMNIQFKERANQTFAIKSDPCKIDNSPLGIWIKNNPEKNKKHNKDLKLLEKIADKNRQENRQYKMYKKKELIPVSEYKKQDIERVVNAAREKRNKVIKKERPAD